MGQSISPVLKWADRGHLEAFSVMKLDRFRDSATVRKALEQETNRTGSVFA
jgi:hypothetical protein